MTMTVGAIGIAIALAIGVVAVWIVRGQLDRRHEQRAQQRRVRQKAYHFAFDLVMRRKRYLRIEHQDVGEQV